MAGLVADVAVKAFFGAVAAAGFAVIFNAPRYTLAWCAACGALGLALRTLGLAFGAGVELATLFASASVSAFSFWPHNRLTLPTHLFSIPGVITMVPGVYAYQAMTGFLRFIQEKDQALFLAAWHNLLTMLTILMALAFGLVLPSLCLRIQKKTL
ncbi:putative inner membrane protein [hydrocarbon metagenome]|uniref:Putative inner membrane protein n=1 Tax=hydrocarbon metagenome TaxID=938273 RepID=A0A0W8GAH7_9ZZZZ